MAPPRKTAYQYERVNAGAGRALTALSNRHEAAVAKEQQESRFLITGDAHGHHKHAQEVQHTLHLKVPDNNFSRHFQFVDTNWFLAVSALVLVANLAVIGLEIVYKDYEVLWDYLDQAFLAFYVVELFCRACHFQHYLLFDCTSSDVWYNYLDTLLVLFCVYDQWIDPLIAGGGLQLGGISSWIRALRALRFLRALRMIRIFLEADTSWAEGGKFQSFVACVILGNAILMGAETDLDWSGFSYFEQIILAIFFFELCVQVKHHGVINFISCANEGFLWNWLDLVIVLGGIFDQWLMPLVDLLGAEVGGGAKADIVGKVMMLMRMMRLLRILRLLRLVKTVRPLYILAQGVLAAMQGMFWVLILTTMTLYAFSILATKLIGHGLLFNLAHEEELTVESETIEGVQHLFGTVYGSMFVLFTVMNGRGDVLEPLFHVIPLMKIVFVIFMVVTSWALLSILTAVLSENMIMVTERQDHEAREEEESMKMADSRARLEWLFKSLQKEGSDALDEDEFEALLEVHKEELCIFSGLAEDDIHEVFDYLSVAGEVTLRDFVDGMLSLALSIEQKRPVSERAMLRLERRLRELESDVGAIKDLLQTQVFEHPDEAIMDTLAAQFGDMDELKELLNKGQGDSSSSDTDDEAQGERSSLSAQPSAMGQPGKASIDLETSSVPAQNADSGRVDRPSSARCPCCGAVNAKETVQKIPLEVETVHKIPPAE